MIRLLSMEPTQELFGLFLNTLFEKYNQKCTKTLPKEINKYFNNVLYLYFYIRIN